MTYEYEILGPTRIGEVIEVEHSINNPPLKIIELDGTLFRVKRLIATGAPFHLRGDCWARNNYDRGMQTPPTKAETDALLKQKRGY